MKPAAAEDQRRAGELPPQIGHGLLPIHTSCRQPDEHLDGVALRPVVLPERHPAEDRQSGRPELVEQLEDGELPGRQPPAQTPLLVSEPTVYSFGDSAELGDYGWYRDNSGSKTHPVGQKKPNAWGLYDMHGNVLEWCADWYSAGYYANSLMDDPPGPASGSPRVVRGGSWFLTAWGCRSAFRFPFSPEFRYGELGFRVARSPSGR